MYPGHKPFFSGVHGTDENSTGTRVSKKETHELKKKGLSKVLESQLGFSVKDRFYENVSRTGNYTFPIPSGP